MKPSGTDCYRLANRQQLHGLEHEYEHRFTEHEHDVLLHARTPAMTEGE